MPLALRENTVPASRLEALRARRARLDDELHAQSQHPSISDLELREKKKLKLLLKDEEESIRSVS